MPWQLEKVGTIVIVRMDSNKLNVMTNAFVDEWEATLDKLETSEYKNCSVIFTGNARAFSAGLDLPFLKSAGGGDPAVIQKVGEYVERIDRLGWRLFTFPRPTVAAINGHAIAGGTLLAAACDVRIADGAVADSAKLGLNEVENGFFIPYRMQKLCSFAFNHRASFRYFTSGKLLTLREASTPSVGFIDEIITPATSTSTSSSQLSPLLRRAVEIASIKPSSFRAYAHTKAVEQESIRTLVESAPERPKEVFLSMFGLDKHGKPRSKL